MPKKLSTLEIKKRLEIRNKENTFLYPDFKYKNMNAPIKIICKKHGEFSTSLYRHLSGGGCPKCAGKYLSTEEWIERFKQVQPSTTTYEKFAFVDTRSKSLATCHIDNHGDFEITAMNHKNGSGCPKCARNKLLSKGAKKISKYLEKNNINYIQEFIFKKCKNKKVLPFDFYLVDLNILIEYDGEQHFKNIPLWGGEEAFKVRKSNDQIKTDFAKKENIELIRIPYTDFDKIEEIINIKINTKVNKCQIIKQIQLN